MKTYLISISPLTHDLRTNHHHRGSPHQNRLRTRTSRPLHSDPLPQDPSRTGRTPNAPATAGDSRLCPTLAPLTLLGDFSAAASREAPSDPLSVTTKKATNPPSNHKALCFAGGTSTSFDQVQSSLLGSAGWPQWHSALDLSRTPCLRAGLLGRSWPVLAQGDTCWRSAGMT